MLATEPSPSGFPHPTEQPLSWKHIARPVEPFLDAVAQRLEEQLQEFEPAVASYAAYALRAQGKQLRPVLLALSAQAVGDVNEAHVQAALIVEMVHLATLVHDDVMDEAGWRRGQPTLAANWGNEIAVLVGDCLFAHALRLAASYPTPEVCRAVAAATHRVCSGEILQTQSRRNFDLSKAQYYKVLQMKTGELFSLSCGLGASLGGSSGTEWQSDLERYGLAVGTAYQIFDDCVDLFGSEAVAGKSLGTDLAKGKLTLPVLVVLERAEPPTRQKIRAMVEHWQLERVPELMHFLRQHGALDVCKEAVSDFLNQARRAIRRLPQSAGKVGLLGLAEYMAEQVDRLEYGVESVAT